jgi:hypothetical protein
MMRRRDIGVVDRTDRKGRCVAPPRGRAIAARRGAVDLSPETVEQVAARVAQLLAHTGGDTGEPRLLSAGELALRLGVERPWVYRHRRLLGGIRLGAGPKAPWRFDFSVAVGGLARREESDVRPSAAGQAGRAEEPGPTQREERTT